ncbi:MAG: caspase family protein, partial [Planctomycetaceae bacterium]|nr:caspase family protein [Planctomycetaceae bacterium]
SFNLKLLEHGEPVTESNEGRFQRAIFEKNGLKLESSGISSVDVNRNGQTVAVLEPTSDYDKAYDRVRCFTLLADNRAVVGSGFALWIYDTTSGERLRQLDGHSGAIWSMSPSPDGRYLLTGSGDMTLRVWDVNAKGDGPIEPLLSLFFAEEEWIAWTPQGYYASSPGGERLMGWHVNNGREQLASFFPASQFHKQFYRPDLIQEVLQTGSVQQALKGTGSSERITTVAENLPPEVEILSPSDASTVASSPEVTVRVGASQTGSNPVTSLQILLDGRPLNGQDGIVQFDGSSRAVNHSFHVPLVPGVEHRIVARASTAVNFGVSKEITVAYQAPSATVRLPSLYVLAIGVADYDDESLKLEFADDDARHLADVLQERSFGLFDKIDTRLVIDKDATQKGILGGLLWLKQQMTQHDIAILFYSGHGARDETGKFYLMPSDVDTSQPLVLSGVDEDQVKGILQGIPGRLLMMLDACHAGVIGGDRRKNSTSLVDDLVRELSNDDYGVIVMASSMGREYSLESPDNKSGMFTLALCEGLDGKADYDGDKYVYLNELDLYISQRMKDLTGGKQHPTTVKPATIRTFPISSIK